jgi:hypothetical protein
MPDCLSCAHLRPSTDETKIDSCDAFPNGIPREIYFGGRSHRRPYPGDHGIRFEPVAGFVDAGAPEPLPSTDAVDA